MNIDINNILKIYSDVPVPQEKIRKHFAPVIDAIPPETPLDPVDFDTLLPGVTTRLEDLSSQTETHTASSMDQLNHLSSFISSLDKIVEQIASNSLDEETSLVLASLTDSIQTSMSSLSSISAEIDTERMDAMTLFNEVKELFHLYSSQTCSEFSQALLQTQTPPLKRLKMVDEFMN
ncbi:hypothetical protein RCL1_000789 [Eukaryota sp. TZLM3-RCL]